MDDSESIDLADVPAYIDNLRARIAALEAAREEWREWAADILASYESDRPPRELRPSNAGTEISEVFTKIDAERDGLRERLAAAVEKAVHVYNSGYHAGHHDTVEGCYTHIVSQDMDSYHDDVVTELLEDLAAEGRGEVTA